MALCKENDKMERGGGGRREGDAPIGAVSQFIRKQEMVCS